jgi:hypothetical protein
LSITPIPSLLIAEDLLYARGGLNVMELAWRTPKGTVTITLLALYYDPSAVVTKTY